jgi:hypothetical protein
MPFRQGWEYVRGDEVTGVTRATEKSFRRGKLKKIVKGRTAYWQRKSVSGSDLRFHGFDSGSEMIPAPPGFPISNTSCAFTKAPTYVAEGAT